MVEPNEFANFGHPVDGLPTGCSFERDVYAPVIRDRLQPFVDGDGGALGRDALFPLISWFPAVRSDDVLVAVAKGDERAISVDTADHRLAVRGRRVPRAIGEGVVDGGLV